MKRVLLLLVAAATLLTLPCEARKKNNMAAYVTPQIECLSVELDGSVTLRSWGTGRNKEDAIEQARKNAVHQILFKGVELKGQIPSLSRALILELNGEQRYQYFFNPFFADGGAYTNFVSTEDTRVMTNKRFRSPNQVTYGVTVRVLRSELKNYLMEENILKK